MENNNALDKAIAYINIKPRTRVQVIKYLENKGFDHETAYDAVKLLEEYKYIDDMEYCRMYFNYGFDKGRGVGRIKRELAEKGVDSMIIESAFEELENVPDQMEMALEIGRSMISTIDTGELSYEEKRKLQARMGRRLISRGFSPDIAYKVINKLI